MIERGQVYLLDLGPTRGKEQSGRRPVLVVSSDAINAQPLAVTIVAGTGSEKIRRDYPTNVRVRAAESGLPKDTVFLCFQVRSLDPVRFHQPPSGKLPQARMNEVDQALRLSLDL